VKQYEIPLDKGIPALAVAESDGKLVVSPKMRVALRREFCWVS
jgi:hypothetical protein